MDQEGTLCKFLIVLPISINIQYLKSLQTGDIVQQYVYMSIYIYTYAHLPAYMHSLNTHACINSLHTCLPTDIHDFHIFWNFHIFGNVEITEI